MSQLPEFIGLLLLGEDEEFRGSAFPVSEKHKLYLGAAHTFPAGREADLRIMVLIRWGSGHRWKITRVKAVEALGGQPDVIALQAENGLPPMKRLAPTEAFLLEEVHAAGYPEMDIATVDGGMRAPGVRALAGSITRKVEVGEALGVKGPAYEVSFPIPAGMSGGPVYAAAGATRRGLIGVCLANVSTNSVGLYEVMEESPGHSKVPQESQKIEYGVVANLHRASDSPIALVGRTLGQLMGFEPPITPAAYLGAAIEPEP
jgi:hypothetical protein